MISVHHHVDQHRLGDLGFTVRFTVDIQVTEAGTSEDTDLTVEWFYPMDVVVMFLQSLNIVEFFVTLRTFLCLLPVSMFPLDVLPQINSAPEHRLAVCADKLCVGVMSVHVKDQFPLTVENPPALAAEMTLGISIMGLLHMIISCDLTLETFPTNLTGHRIDMGTVNLYRMQFQSSIG